MRIAVIGSSGYIGHNLIEKLIKETNHEIVALSPNADSIKFNNKKLTKINVDVFDTKNLAKNIKNCDMAFYLIHMMSQKKIDFAEAESLAARSFCNSVIGSKVQRVIYLGGLGNDEEKLSKHLKSRHETGQILKNNLPQLIEFRASMVIGHGSISYDIITNLIHRLPILTLPKWAKTLTQPIGLEDALKYLIAALALKTKESHIVEIGGPEQLSYGDLMRRYAAWRNKKMIIIRFHVIPLTIAAWWLNLFTPRTHAKVGRIMVESLSNPMVVTNDKAKELFPDIHPKSLEEVLV